MPFSRVPGLMTNQAMDSKMSSNFYTLAMNKHYSSSHEEGSTTPNSCYSGGEYKEVS
jgi:hypothetical protein